MYRAFRSTFLILLCLCCSTQAAMVEDYTLFAVATASSSGNDAIYGYTALGSSPVEFNAIPNPPQYINGLTTDPSRNRLLFVRDGVSGSPIGNLWSYDLGTGIYSDLGNISTPQINVQDTSGGGGFYNGSYYYWDDADFGPGDDQGLIRVDFAGDGTVDSTTTVWESAQGDFGDIAIDRNTGIMYASSQGGNGDWNFWSLDLNAITPSRNNIASDVPYQQIAFDNNGDLIGVEITTGSAPRRWYTISLADGTSSFITRPTPPGDVYDLGDGGLYNQQVPEPASILLLSLAAASGIGYYRRKRKQIASESEQL